MGQGGSSELRLSPTSGGGSSQTASAEPPLRWLRVSRTSRSSLAAEWRWAGDIPAGRVDRCHLLFLRSDAAWRDRAPMQRVQIDPSAGSYTMTNLSQDSSYRVCLQCAASTNYTRDAEGRAPEAMHCVNVSTKQAHIPAIIGSCLGALCALLLVLILVMVSRRTQKYRKVNERQASTTKKVVVHEIAYQTDNLPLPKMELDSNSDGYVYDGSEDQQGSTVSDDTLTPPAQPPPPPPTLQLSTVEKDSGGGATVEKPQEFESLLPPPADQQLQQQPPSASPAEEASGDDSAAPPPPSSPPKTPDPVTDAATTSTPQATGLDDCRQVIQVNETDEYSIDLRLCNSLSRQQSLRAASASGSSSGIGSAVRPDDQRTAASSGLTVQGSESHQDSTAVSSVPSLYTQLIETL